MPLCFPRKCHPPLLWRPGHTGSESTMAASCHQLPPGPHEDAQEEGGCGPAALAPSADLELGQAGVDSGGYSSAVLGVAPVSPLIDDPGLRMGRDRHWPGQPSEAVFGEHPTPARHSCLPAPRREAEQSGRWLSPACHLGVGWGRVLLPLPIRTEGETEAQKPGPGGKRQGPAPPPGLA